MKVRETIDWGIDLGTTNSLIAVFEGKDVKVIKNNDGDEITPSVVYEKKVADSIVRYVGKVAKQKLINESEHMALEFKQKMGLKDWYFEFPSTGRKATAVDLSAEVLGELIKSVKQKENEDVYSALITVSAAFYNPMFSDTKKAGEIAGLKYVETLAEPIAAALAFGLKADTTHKVIWLAYDLGGGTFDAALVKMEEGVFNVFGHVGLPYLGGKNLDAAIVDEYLTPSLPKQIRERVVPWKSSSWYTLKSVAETAKCQLSTRNDFTINCEIDGHAVVYKLTRDELNKLEDQILSPTIVKCKELLLNNKFESKHIEKVILIGGPTLSPHLRKLIEDGLQIPIDFSVDPLTAVARGAALCAKEKRIPDDILKEIRTKIHGEKDIHLNVILNYPPTTTEDEIMITGKIVSKKKEINISSDWSIEIMRVDKGGNTFWTSNRISITEHGGFARTVPLVEGENLFRFVVTGADSKAVENDKEYFSVAKSPIESGKSLLPRSIGIADEHGDVIWFFKKGDPLPAERTDILKTTKYLSKGAKGEVLKFPAVEGNENKAYLNQLIGTLTIEAERVNSNIPEGSNVELTIKIDKSQTIEVSAWFEDYDIEANATMALDLDFDPKKLNTEINEIKDALSKLKQIKDLDPEVKKIIEEVEKNRVVEGIETLSSQASKEMPEPAQKAQEKILELRKQIDPVIESGNKLLKWKAHKEWCDRNITIANNIVREVGDLPSDWLNQFKQLLAQYETAVMNKDFKRTEEVAYSNLPNLFRTSEKLRDRVGGSGCLPCLPHSMNYTTGESLFHISSDVSITCKATYNLEDKIHFTLITLSSVEPDTSFLLDVWAHLEKQRTEVVRRAQESYKENKIQIKSKGPVQVTRGTILTVRLKFDELIVDNPEDTILWDGEIGNATFLVTVPKDVNEGTKNGLVTIYANGLQIARLYFDIQIGKASSKVNRIPTHEERHRKAFASYASEDRNDVLARIQGIQKAAPYLNIFLDVFSLRSGQAWEQELWKTIPMNDIFYLFWSDSASKSEWVEKEWRCALKSKGIDFIDPVPLVSPEEVPPPPELASKHFNDWVLAFMRTKRTEI